MEDENETEASSAAAKLKKLRASLEEFRKASQASHSQKTVSPLPRKADPKIPSGTLIITPYEQNPPEKFRGPNPFF